MTFLWTPGEQIPKSVKALRPCKNSSTSGRVLPVLILRRAQGVDSMLERSGDFVSRFLMELVYLIIRNVTDLRKVPEASSRAQRCFSCSYTVQTQLKVWFVPETVGATGLGLLEPPP